MVRQNKNKKLQIYKIMCTVELCIIRLGMYTEKLNTIRQFGLHVDLKAIQIYPKVRNPKDILLDMEQEQNQSNL